AGHHLSPQLLSSGRNVFEELGSAFSLIALDAADGTIAAFSDAAASMNVPLNIIQDTFADKRKEYEARLILVRPDHFVASCANDPAASDWSGLARQRFGCQCAEAHDPTFNACVPRVPATQAQAVGKATARRKDLARRKTDALVERTLKQRPRLHLCRQFQPEH